ncbi:MAG TPA: hypothetical protein VG244_00325, partial [Acidimicrobiales bacterium]|nr:hypothetical protein [Acidimicrobiales bacterium]
GWWFRPSSGGFAAVPDDLQFYVTKAPAGEVYDESVTRNAGGAVLTLSGQGAPDVSPTGPFTLVVNHLGDGHLCTPRSYTVEGGGAQAVREPPQHLASGGAIGFTTPGSYQLNTITGGGVFYVRLCWASNGPVSLNGSYLSARLPSVTPFGSTLGRPGTRQLNLGSLDQADYAVQSLQHPTSVTEGGWQWSARISPYEPLSFNAVNTSETQHDSYQAFLSGIVFGVAGGALVALIQEFVAPFRARRELRPPEPGG